MLTYGADAHFRQGSAHELEGTPCQDWAMAGGADGMSPFAVLSDGCSTSGMTDVGARLLSLGAARAFRSGASPREPSGFRDQSLRAAEAAAAFLGLAPADLDATLGFVAADDAGATAMLFGDGAIVWRGGPGGLQALIVDWVGGMPGYPAYLSGPAARLQCFLDESERLSNSLGRPPCLVERLSLDAAGRVVSQSIEGMSARAGLDGIGVRWVAQEAPDVVAVMTDGVHQVTGVARDEVLGELTAIKAARAGAFATRRMSRALDGWLRRGSRPTDDLAIAALAAK